MIDAGILDGDTVVIERCDTAENGTIVVALIDNEEATLKRLRRKGGAVAMAPANKAYETRIFPPERVAIQGRLVSLLPRYEKRGFASSACTRLRSAEVREGKES